jgi:hypothetical protein
MDFLIFFKQALYNVFELSEISGSYSGEHEGDSLGTLCRVVSWQPTDDSKEVRTSGISVSLYRTAQRSIPGNSYGRTFELARKSLVTRQSLSTFRAMY